MNNMLLKSTILASALLLGACASTPTTTPMLDQARGDFIAANTNPQVSSYAPLEFKLASDALEQANAAAARRESLEQIDKLAYLAKQKIATAQQVASQQAAEADIANAGRQRGVGAHHLRAGRGDFGRRQVGGAGADGVVHGIARYRHVRGGRGLLRSAAGGQGQHRGRACQRRQVVAFGAHGNSP
jgi:hypothetical protein